MCFPPCSVVLRTKPRKVVRDVGPPKASYQPTTKGAGAGKEGGGGSRSFSEVARPHSRVLPSFAPWEGFPSPSLETQRPRKPNLGLHLGAASAAGPTVLTVVLVPVPPPRHAARPRAAEPSRRAGSTEGTVGTPAGARTAARRAEGPARRRTRSLGLPEAQGGAAGWTRRCLGAPQAAGFRSARNRPLTLPLAAPLSRHSL